MAASHPLGTIACLWRYPVKSLRAEALNDACFGPEGLAGDRRSALFVETPQHARTGKTLRGKEHNLLHTVASSGDAVALARSRDLEVRERGGGPYFDAAPVSLILDLWLTELETFAGRSLDPLRFRPNIFVTTNGTDAGKESDVVGTLLRAGAVRLRVLKPIERCVTPSYDVATGEPHPNVLRHIVRDRANVLGVYCSVEQAGTLAAGDTLFIER